MKRSDIIARLVGLLVFAAVGFSVGNRSGEWFPVLSPYVTYAMFVCTVLFGAVGVMLAPMISTRPFSMIRHAIQQLPASMLFSTIIGLFLGLAFGAITAYPVSLLPAPFGQVLPFLVAAIFGYLGVMTAMMRPDVIQILRERFFPMKEVPKAESVTTRPILLDTSVIIDGRIYDICRTGFVPGELVIPLFVLNELQHIADSPDALRRNRGRRGLEILKQLQEDSPVVVRITDVDVEGVREVDDKLITLARKLEASILTNDYNLNRVADLQGVKVLNVNELANAVKTVLLPGEAFDIYVMQEGKESDQGVGYLDDGTMVVIEEGRPLIGQTIPVVVSKVLQTAAGRMIFARPMNIGAPIA